MSASITEEEVSHTGVITLRVISVKLFAKCLDMVIFLLSCIYFGSHACVFERVIRHVWCRGKEFPLGGQ